MRLSLAVKLTLTSTLLVAVVVAFLAVMQNARISEDFRAVSESRSAEYRAQIQTQAESVANVLAVAVSEHLQGMELAPLDQLTRELIKQNPQILSVQIANERGEILADSGAAIDPGALQKLSREAGPLLGPITRELRYTDKEALALRRPIIATQGKEVGAVEFVYDLSPLVAQQAELKARGEQALSDNTRFTLQVGLGALILGGLLAFFQSLRYARPIESLAQSTRRIAAGEFSARVEVTSQDEVGELGSSFNDMASRLEDLVKESVAKAELDHELNLARDIQLALVPKAGSHHAPGVELAGYYEPASNVGGDFWDLAVLPRGRTCVFIGDVTGHGVPASILTATAKGSLDTLRHAHGGDIQVAETMRVLDRVIHEAGKGAFFMTAAVAVIDSAEGALYYSAAAHPSGLLLRMTESGMLVSRLSARGNRLGDGDGAGFEAKRVRINKGDLLIWYTDGLIDAVNASGQAYTARRLLHLLGKLTVNSRPEDIVQVVQTDLQRFRGKAALADDVTLVVGRVT